MYTAPFYIMRDCECSTLRVVYPLSFWNSVIPFLVLFIGWLSTRAGANSGPELELLANSNSNSGIGIGIELAFPSLTGIGIELELPVFELELNWNCHNLNWNWSRNCVLRNRIRNCFPWN